MKIVMRVFAVLAACCLVFSQGTAATAKPLKNAKMESDAIGKVSGASNSIWFAMHIIALIIT